jgi:hypothetical protein
MRFRIFNRIASGWIPGSYHCRQEFPSIYLIWDRAQNFAAQNLIFPFHLIRLNSSWKVKLHDCSYLYSILFQFFVFGWWQVCVDGNNSGAVVCWCSFKGSFQVFVGKVSQLRQDMEF